MLWHFLLESLAYFVAFRLYLQDRRKSGDFLADSLRWSIVAAAMLGAAVGSKLLYWLEEPVRTLHHWDDFAYLMAGKTIIGAILGGTIAVELTKRRLGIAERTGDLFAVPLAAGIAIGRLGCVAAGVPDGTYGLPTNLPWGINLGDGVCRHPVQLYEAGAMLALIFLLRRIGAPAFECGDKFRLFLLAYFGWRLLIDFLKPAVRFGGLGTLQWVCVLALLWYARDVRRMIVRRIRRKEILAHA